jgi:hypothetical protein
MVSARWAGKGDGGHGACSTWRSEREGHGKLMLKLA